MQADRVSRRRFPKLGRASWETVAAVAVPLIILAVGVPVLSAGLSDTAGDYPPPPSSTTSPPNTSPGSSTTTASGGTTATTAAAAGAGAAGAAAGAGSLAVTGSDNWLQVLIGIALLLAGVLLLIATHRRRRPHQL